MDTFEDYRIAKCCGEDPSELVNKLLQEGYVLIGNPFTYQLPRGDWMICQALAKPIRR